MRSFHLERIKKNIKLRLFFYKVSKEGGKILNNLKLVEYRTLPFEQHVESSKVTKIVCEGIIYIILWTDPTQTIVIENDLVAKEYLYI
jgi:hypothetical protein